MRCVLVDEHDAGRGFGQDVGAVQLDPRGAERRFRDGGRRRGLRRRAVERHRRGREIGVGRSSAKASAGQADGGGKAKRGALAA